MKRAVGEQVLRQPASSFTHMPVIWMEHIRNRVKDLADIGQLDQHEGRDDVLNGNLGMLDLEYPMVIFSRKSFDPHRAMAQKKISRHANDSACEMRVPLSVQDFELHRGDSSILKEMVGGLAITLLTIEIPQTKATRVTDTAKSAQQHSSEDRAHSPLKL